jgi:hypothetical protein
MMHAYLVDKAEIPSAILVISEPSPLGALTMRALSTMVDNKPLSAQRSHISYNCLDAYTACSLRRLFVAGIVNSAFSMSSEAVERELILSLSDPVVVPLLPRISDGMRSPYNIRYTYAV